MQCRPRCQSGTCVAAVQAGRRRTTRSSHSGAKQQSEVTPGIGQRVLGSRAVTVRRYPASAGSPGVGWRSLRRHLDTAPLESAADASVNPAIVFACQYARLVWLLLHDPRNVEEQKDALRAAMAVIGQGGVTIARRGSRVFANGKALPDTLAAGPELGAQMMAHGVMVIEIAASSPPADLLGTARIFSTPATRGDKGQRAKEQLEAVKTASVKFAFEDASLGPKLDDKLA